MFAAVTCVALAMAAYGPILPYVRWNTARHRFTEWASSIDRTDGKIYSYALLNRGLGTTALHSVPNPRPFLVANAEIRLAAQSTGEMMMLFDPIGKPPDPDRFYILPEKKWVNDSLPSSALNAPPSLATSAPSLPSSVACSMPPRIRPLECQQSPDTCCSRHTKFASQKYSTPTRILTGDLQIAAPRCPSFD